MTPSGTPLRLSLTLRLAEPRFHSTPSREHSYLAHCSPPPSTSVTCRPPAAQAPARALYKKVRGQRSVASPHTSYSSSFSCSFSVIVFLLPSWRSFFISFYIVPRTSMCSVSLRLGTSVHIPIIFSQTAIRRITFTVPRSLHGQAEHHISMNWPQGIIAIYRLRKR